METVVYEVAERIAALPSNDSPLLVAIDGRCAAGKTTLADMLHKRTNCTVFHMDDFFLRPEQRSIERLSIPGGNVDYERFREEVLMPLRKGVTEIAYQPFDCHEQRLLPPVVKKVTEVVLVEGSYSCHPELWDYYNLHIFLTIASDKQLKRIACRNGADNVSMFQNQWIPLEERYFEVHRIMKRCELCFDM